MAARRERSVCAKGADGLMLAVLWILAGCDTGVDPRPNDGIEYHVEGLEVIWRDREEVPFPIAYLSAELALVNHRPDSLHLEYSPAAMQMVGALLDPDGERAVWRSNRSRVWPYGVEHGIPLILLRAVVAPGDTLRMPALEFTVPLADILADSLPTGRYGFQAAVGYGLPPRQVDLGSVPLPESRFPLPEHQTWRDGFRYTVDVEPAAGVEPAGGGYRVTLRVDHSILVDRSLERVLSRSCPVRILAFDREEAVTAIPVPEPVWTWPRDCPAGDVRVRLVPGEFRSFEATFNTYDLPPTAPSGTYHLMGVIEADGRLMHLSVGSLEVAR